MRAYWRRICAYLGALGLSKEDAEDATQTLLADFTNGGAIGRVDPAKGRLRHFLKAAARHALYNHRSAAKAVRRGGGQADLSLDELPDSAMLFEAAAPDAAFDHTWAWTVFDRAFQAITESYALRGKGELLEAMKPALLPSGALQSYAEIGSVFGVGEAQIQLEVHRLRRRYRELFRNEIAQTVTSPEEVDDELKHLFAVLAG